MIFLFPRWDMLIPWRVSPQGFQTIEESLHTFSWSLRGRPYRYVIPSQHIFFSINGLFDKTKKEGEEPMQSTHTAGNPHKKMVPRKKNHGVWNEGSVVHLGKINGWKLRVYRDPWKKLQTSEPDLSFSGFSAVNLLGCQTLPEIGNLLIAGELWEQALAVLESMTTFQLSLDVITFNLAITSCANSTQKSMALQVLQRMLGLLIFFIFPSHAPDKNDVLSRPSEGMINIHKESTFPGISGHWRGGCIVYP